MKQENLELTPFERQCLGIINNQPENAKISVVQVSEKDPIVLARLDDQTALATLELQHRTGLAFKLKPSPYFALGNVSASGEKELADFTKITEGSFVIDQQAYSLFYGRAGRIMRQINNQLGGMTTPSPRTSVDRYRVISGLLITQEGGLFLRKWFVWDQKTGFKNRYQAVKRWQWQES